MYYQRGNQPYENPPGNVVGVVILYAPRILADILHEWTDGQPTRTTISAVGEWTLFNESYRRLFLGRGWGRGESE